MNLKKFLLASIATLIPISYGLEYYHMHNTENSQNEAYLDSSLTKVNSLAFDAKASKDNHLDSKLVADGAQKKSITETQDNNFNIKMIDVVAKKYHAPIKLEPLIVQYASKYKVPLDLAHAIIHTESRFNVKAHGKAGEIGLMQLMPMTARSLGYKGSMQKLYNPVLNLDYGMRYLAKAHTLGKGDLCRTILKYNAGSHATKMNPVSTRYCCHVKDYLANV